MCCRCVICLANDTDTFSTKRFSILVAFVFNILSKLVWHPQELSAMQVIFLRIKDTRRVVLHITLNICECVSCALLSSLRTGTFLNTLGRVTVVKPGIVIDFKNEALYISSNMHDTFLRLKFTVFICKFLGFTSVHLFTVVE